MKQDIYQVEQIAPGTWRIDECGRDNCYLLCGGARALLIDCSIGTGALMDVVRSLTDLPLTVAVTHAHGDHAGGGYQFGTIYVPRAETDRTWRGPNMRVFRKQLLSNKMKKSGVTKKNVRGNNLKTNWLPFDDQSDRLTGLLDGYTLFCGHGDGRVTHELLQQQIGWVREILEKYPANAARHGKKYYPAFDPDGCVGYDPANLYPAARKKGWTIEAWNSILRG